jgi:hypothetical protein
MNPQLMTLHSFMRDDKKWSRACGHLRDFFYASHTSSTNPRKTIFYAKPILDMASTLALTLRDRLRISRSTVGNITDTRSSEQPPSPHQDLDSERLASPGTVPELAGADNDQGGVEYIL